MRQSGSEVFESSARVDRSGNGLPVDNVLVDIHGTEADAEMGRRQLMRRLVLGYVNHGAP
jgi:hypothetical protein